MVSHIDGAIPFYAPAKIAPFSSSPRTAILWVFFSNVIVRGSGGWTLVRLQLVGASFSRRFACRFRVVFRVVNSVSIGETAKPRVVQGLWYAVVLEGVSASFVVNGSTGTCWCKFCRIR